MKVVDQLGELRPEERRHKLILSQNDCSEVLYQRENEIQDKIEQEKRLTEEEWHFFVARKTQQLIDAVDRVSERAERN